MGISFKPPGMPNSPVISIFNASEEGNTLNITPVQFQQFSKTSFQT